MLQSRATFEAKVNANHSQGGTRDSLAELCTPHGRTIVESKKLACTINTGTSAKTFHYQK